MARPRPNAGRRFSHGGLPCTAPLLLRPHTLVVRCAVAGAGSGMALLAIGNVSLQNYKQRRVVDKRLTAASLVITSIVGAAMLRRYRASGKLLPAGLIVAISAAMIAFYAWSLAYGPKSTLRSTKKPA